MRSSTESEAGSYLTLTQFPLEQPAERPFALQWRVDKC